MDKYFKYKNKNKKIQNGGIIIEKTNQDAPFINMDIDEPENILFIPMNYFISCNIDEKRDLITFGMMHCVVIGLYNKNYGRYFTHIPYPTFFDENQNSALEDNDSGGKYDCNDTELCSGIYLKIKNSLPSWINHPETQLFIISNSDIDKIQKRFEQIITFGFNGTATIYYPTDKIQSSSIIFQKDGLFGYTNDFFNFPQKIKTKAQLFITNRKCNKDNKICCLKEININCN